MKRVLCCLILVALATELYADQKVKKRMSFGQQSFDTTTYIKGQRSRDEMNFGQFQMITIHQCDLGQDVSVNDRTKTYMVTKTGATGAKNVGTAGARGLPEDMEFDPPVPPGGRKGGTVTISSSVQDTGERKDFFGYEAKHLKTTLKVASSPDACNPNQNTTISSDGWYINFKEKVQLCERPMTSGGGGNPMRSEASCVDKVRMTGGGGGMSMFGGQGYPVDVTMNFTDPQGKTTSMRTQALEVSSATLDPGLFDAPGGYRQANSMMEMMGMGGGMGAMAAARGRSASTSRAPARTPEATPEARGRSRTPEVRGARRMVGTREIGPKQPGKMRVCAVAFNDKSGKMTDADTLRRALMDGIEHYGYETIPIDSQSQSAAMRDAKDFDCDYVVFNDMTPKVSAGQTAKKIGGMFGRSLGGLTGGAADRATADANSFSGTVDFQLFKVATPDNPSLTGTNEAQGKDGGKQAMDKESKDVAKQVAKGK